VKKEQQERARVKIAKVNYVLRVQEVLTCLQDEAIVAQLLVAESPNLSKEQLLQLLKFQELATPTRDGGGETSFDSKVAASADHLLSLAEQKAKRVPGTSATYKDLAALLEEVMASPIITAAGSSDKDLGNNTDTVEKANVDDDDTQEEEEEEVSSPTSHGGEGDIVAKKVVRDKPLSVCSCQLRLQW